MTMFGISPEAIQQAQAVGQQIKAQITVQRSQGTLSITFQSDNPQVSQAIPDLVVGVAKMMAQTLYQYLGITGRVVEK